MLWQAASREQQAVARAQVRQPQQQLGGIGRYAAPAGDAVTPSVSVIAQAASGSEEAACAAPAHGVRTIFSASRAS